DATVNRHTLGHRFRKLEALLESLVDAFEPAAQKTTPADEPIRVLLVNQAYAPDAAATAQHCEDLARHLTAQGHGVSVIASRSIYGQSGANLPRRETLDGVHVHRVGLSLFGKRGIALRALDFGLFYVAALWRAVGVKVPLDGPNQGERKSKKPDVVVTLTTPPFIGGVGVLLRWLRGCRHIYWAMDLYPDVLVAAGVSKPRGIITRMLAALNRWEMCRADRVVALGRCMRDLIQSQSIKPDHIDVIGVWAPTAPDERVADPAASSYRETWELHGKFVVQYSGNFGLAHDYRTFCDATRRVQHRDDIVFLFAGGGKRVAAVKAFAEEHGLKNVMFQPYQPRENLPDLLTLANVHLISQSQTFTGIVVPSKLFGIMAAGRASLFVGPAEAEVARVLEETGAGRRFDIGAGEALANKILELADHPERAAQMGRAALDAARGPHHQQSRYAAWEKLLVSVSRRKVVKRNHAPGRLRSAMD
ncbi:MAG: glycosyltransferase family 4 protein, partial [Planctomycetota bacterium]